MGSCSAAKAERNNARSSLRLPDLAGCSPRIEVPDRWVTGAMPAYAARCPADLNAEPSPTSSRIRAAAGDSDAWHRDQDRGKRVGIKHPLYVHADCFPLLQCLFERVCQLGKHSLGGRRPGDHYGLRLQCGGDFYNWSCAHEWRVLRGGRGADSRNPALRIYGR